MLLLDEKNPQNLKMKKDCRKMNWYSIAAFDIH